MLRISPHYYNTEDEVREAIDQISDVVARGAEAFAPAAGD
jgi:selenocysteine lyase/cysteine desulfurase